MDVFPLVSDSVWEINWDVNGFNRFTKEGAIFGEYGTETGYEVDDSEDPWRMTEESKHREDSSFVWRLNDDGKTATGIWTTADGRRYAELTYPVPVSKLNQNVELSEDERRNLRRAMKTSHDMAPRVDKAMREASDYRQHVSAGGFDAIGRNVLDGDMVEVDLDLDSGKTAIGKIRIDDGPKVEFNYANFEDFDLYVDDDGYITTAVDDDGKPTDGFYVPRTHKTSYGKTMTIKRIIMKPARGEDAFTEIDRRRSSALELHKTLGRRQAEITRRRIDERRTKLLDEERQHRAEYDKKNFVYKIFNSYEPKWTEESIASDLKNLEMEEYDRNYLGIR